MKEILWIRHAQSVGNAGMPTENRSSFPLSAVGYEQAQALAKKIPFTPDLIVSSPFRRAWETAAPTSARYPAIKMEIWPEIHEFTYLSPATCVGTTSEDRRPRSEAYWARLDPDYLDGSDAETFRDVMARAELAIEHLQDPGNGRFSSSPTSCSSNAFSSPCAPPICPWRKRFAPSRRCRRYGTAK